MCQELSFRGMLRRHGEVMEDICCDEDDSTWYPDPGTGKQKACNERIEDSQAGPISGARPTNPTIVPEEPVVVQNAGMVEPSKQKASGPDVSDDEAPPLHRDMLAPYTVRFQASGRVPQLRTQTMQ